MKTVEAESIADILLKDKILTAEQKNLVVLETINTGKTIDEVILSHGFATEDQLVSAKAKLLGIPFITLSGKGISPEVLNFIPEPVARRFDSLPFDYNRKENLLSVAMIDPLDIEVLEFLEKKSGCNIKPFMGYRPDIETAIEAQYSQTLATEVTAALKETTLPVEELLIEGKKLGEVIREAPVAKIVSTILEYAIRARASDIHIEPQEERTRVRYRIDGILHEKLALPKKVHEAVISRIKILSEMKIDEKRIPQDGRFTFRAGDEIVDLRVSSLPTVFGEKIVMRLLKKTGGVPSLQELGLRGLALRNLETAMLRPYGVIIVCGPTGSGKTTTLYSVLSKINSTRVNIITLEDPVEYQIPGVNQVQINPQAGLTFATGLRSLLRQDPNIMLVGEIRDSETTALAIQAALTGHLVFSTLHTNNAAGALPRLTDMGAEPFLLASSINAVVAQRICRRVCLHCKESYDPLPEVIADMKMVLGKYIPKSPQVKLFKGKGCNDCSRTGYIGRTGIFEVFPISKRISELILEKGTAADIEKIAVDEGMITMIQDGYLKVLEGITTLEEVLRVAQA
jgi:type IV pilus assembly protein PilB